MDFQVVRQCVRIALASVLPTVIIAVGCGQSTPFDIVKVKGKVTYEDGSLIPAHRLVVKFHPQVEAIDAKTHPRYAQAEADPKTGEFIEATTHIWGDGVIPGQQKITVEAWKKGDSPNGNVAPVYADALNTPLETEVKQSNEPFVFKVPKPKKVVPDK
jgi:hypothetical protein